MTAVLPKLLEPSGRSIRAESSLLLTLVTGASGFGSGPFPDCPITTVGRGLPVALPNSEPNNRDKFISQQSEQHIVSIESRCERINESQVFKSVSGTSRL